MAKTSTPSVSVDSVVGSQVLLTGTISGALSGYDKNGNPVAAYDKNGNAVTMYDKNGNPI